MIVYDGTAPGSEEHVMGPGDSRAAAESRHQGGPTSAASHHKYNTSERGQARMRRHDRSPARTYSRATRELRKLGEL